MLGRVSWGWVFVIDFRFGLMSRELGLVYIFIGFVNFYIKGSVGFFFWNKGSCVLDFAFRFFWILFLI